MTSDALVRLLSEDDLDTLYRAKSLRTRFKAGIFPSNVGQQSHFRKLERLGLLSFGGYGRDLDHGVDRDVPIYWLTEGAQKIIDARDAYVAALGAVFAPRSCYEATVTPVMENGSSHG